MLVGKNKGAAALITALLLVILVLAGCGSKESAGAEPGPSPGPGADPAPAADPLGDLLDYFGAQGLAVGAKITKAPETIGAVAGLGVELGGGQVELYLFDRATADEDALQLLADAESKQRISIWGMSLAAWVQGDILLTGADEHPQGDRVLEVFRQFK